MPLWQGFVWGVLGGLLAELLQWFAIRQSLHEGLPEWSRSLAYWIVTLLMVVAGGVLVLAHMVSGVTLNALIAINLGISAPLVLQKLATRLPPIEPGRTD